MTTKQNTTKKLISFTQKELDFVHSYRNANCLKTDTDVIRLLIAEEIKRRREFIATCVDENAEILRELAKR